MKNFHKFLGAAMLFCFMMLSTVDTAAQQQYGQKTVQLKQMFEAVHGDFANNANARQAFHPTTSNVVKWEQVVNVYESNNNTPANQMAILNEFYDKISTRAQQ